MQIFGGLGQEPQHLALALWSASRTAGPITLPTGGSLEVLDFQTPLKARQNDKGVGKVDLFGLVDNCRAAVIELKVLPTTGHGDTPLRAYLEALENRTVPLSRRMRSTSRMTLKPGSES